MEPHNLRFQATATLEYASETVPETFKGSRKKAIVPGMGGGGPEEKGLEKRP